jgi:hypothetical protein
MLNGTTGPAATGLVSTAPQLICLVIVGRLAAPPVVGDPYLIALNGPAMGGLAGRLAVRDSR